MRRVHSFDSRELYREAISPVKKYREPADFMCPRDKDKGLSEQLQGPVTTGQTGGLEVPVGVSRDSLADVTEGQMAPTWHSVDTTT